MARETTTQSVRAALRGWLPGRGAGALSRRWWPLAVALGVLLLLGFYSATDPARLAHDPVLGGADYVGYALCHRITSHSLLLNGRQLPLCARCTGMYLGVALSFVVLTLSGRGRRADLPPFRVMLVLLGFVGVMGIDGLNSYSHFIPKAPHLYEPRNWLRLTTGMGTGLMMGVVVFPALAQTLWQNRIWEPPVATLRELAGLVALAGVLVLLVLSNQAPLLYVLGIVSAAGVLLVVTSLNVIFLLMALRRDGKATRWQQVLVPLALGLALAVVEIGAIDVVRFQLTGTMAGFPGLS